MSPFVETLNSILALGTVGLLVGAAVLLAFHIHEIASKRVSSVGFFISKWSILFIAKLAFIASVLTLVYSEVFGFLPCGLCWFERIALYPMVIIAGGASFMKDKVFAPVYMLWLSGIGAMIALYHHYLQMGGSELIDCPISGVSCAKRIIFEFGFVTFPLMAFALFAFIFVLLLVQRRYARMAV